MIRSRATVLAATLAATALAVSACASSSSPGSGSSTSSSTSSPESSSADSSSVDAGQSGSGSSDALSSDALSSGAVSSGATSGSSDSSMMSGSAGESSGSGPTGSGGAPGSIVIGSANFDESVLLMNVYADALKAKGVTVTLKPKIGSREVYMPALKDGSIGLIPEYSGAVLAYFDKTNTATTSDAIFAALPKAVGNQLKVLNQSKAQDQDAIVVQADTAKKYNLKSIGDLKPVAKDLILGAGPEFKTRANGVPGLKAKYGVEFGQFKTLDPGGPLSVAALKNGQIDASNIFTTDPAIAANKFVALEDPDGLYTAQNVFPLVRADKVTPTISSTLDAVSAKLDTDTLTKLNEEVAGGKDADAVAQAWLKSQSLL